jgi:hypothetical protein
MDYKRTTTQEKQILINLIYIQDGLKDYEFKPRE